jgi:hypothetical protein
MSCFVRFTPPHPNRPGRGFWGVTGPVPAGIGR